MVGTSCTETGSTPRISGSGSPTRHRYLRHRPRRRLRKVITDTVAQALEVEIVLGSLTLVSHREGHQRTAGHPRWFRTRGPRYNIAGAHLEQATHGGSGLAAP